MAVAFPARSNPTLTVVSSPVERLPRTTAGCQAPDPAGRKEATTCCSTCPDEVGCLESHHAHAQTAFPAVSTATAGGAYASTPSGAVRNTSVAGCQRAAA